MENTDNKNNNQNLRIKMSEDQSRGLYSNAMRVTHTKNEFAVDFFFSAFQPENILLSRVIMSPAHLKRTVKALEENIRNYESKFGAIVEGGDGSEAILGFHPDSQSNNN